MRYDLVIIGMGSAGMTAAEFASTLGVKVAAVERGRFGGDCLWTGCVPSKALLASAKAAHTMRHADHYGLTPVEPEIDTVKVWSRIRAIQQDLAGTTDSPQRFRDLGVDLYFADATLTGPSTVALSTGETLATRFVLLCTGSRPVEPPIEGLHEAGFLTSETVFEIERAPESLILVGGGPIAVELSQAFTRLGTRTTVLERADRILAKDDAGLVERLITQLRTDGVDLHLGVEIERVTVEQGRKVVHAKGRGSWAADELLVGAGRQANVEGLGLEALGIEVRPGKGIVVDDKRRTSVKSVYACGDVAGRWLFTHSAGFEAARAVRNMFFPGSAGGDFTVPWCTFTDPELAHVGLTEDEARAVHGADDVRAWRHELRDSDRARAEGAAEGAISIVTHKGRVVGAHILAPGAGELIHELALAVHQKLKLSELAGMVHVYPTLAIGIQQLAAEAAYESAERYRFLVRSSA